jgi:hypothetical protein
VRALPAIGARILGDVAMLRGRGTGVVQAFADREPDLRRVHDELSLVAWA